MLRLKPQPPTERKSWSFSAALEEAGWCRVDELLNGCAEHGPSISRPELDRIVAENDKQRFEFSADATRIRARQGRSIEVDLGYVPRTPPGRSSTAPRPECNNTFMRMLERAKKDRAKFLNPVETPIGGFSMIFKLLPLYLNNQADTVPRQPLGPFSTDPRVFDTPPASGLRITWFGHSCLLIEIDGVNLLLDPVWDERASPFRFMGPKRFFPPTLALDQLPRLDAVLFSHDHYDHLGAETVRTLARQRPKLRWVCPLAVGAVLRGFGVAAGQITELDWTESVELAGGVTLTALPTRHFSGRSMSNRFETLWACLVLAGAKHKVFYGADSGLWDGFATIGREYGPFDLTLLEVGAFHPLWSGVHMGPDGAVEAFQALGGGVLMPIHWGLFNLALHAWRAPIERVYELAAERSLKLFSPEPGRPQEFHKLEEYRSLWWQD